MTFPTCFDAVIMMTWSDWKIEPRSNRYHYATRFARTVPVLFLQHRYLLCNELTVEPTEIQNLDIVNVSPGLNDSQIAAFKQLMHARGIRRPLVWIYDSVNYQPLLEAMPAAFRVYHATEDYLTETYNWSSGKADLVKSVVRILEQVDFMVACSEGVATSCLTLGKYKGRYTVIENGCDAEYFLEYASRVDHANNASTPPSAIFQGGINNRLDYPLIHALIQRMPTWEFRFCGNAVESDAWSAILKLPNVKYYGVLKPEKFAQLMCESTVGIIIYIQDQWIRNSLPLKSYEYVACGLPVVSVPITALEREPDLITIATTPAEFETALLAAAKTRFDSVLLQRRREIALIKSYNVRFDSMCQHLQDAIEATRSQKKKLQLAMLYDSVGSIHVSTIQQHLDAFAKYSNHAVTYVPATSSFWNLPLKNEQRMVDFSYFDIVVVHYSVRLSIREHLDEGLARAIESYNGFKVLFIQDEYEGTEIARQWMDRLQFNVVYTCVPDSGREYVYPSYRFTATEFLPTLTGYISDDSDIEQYAQPIADRKLLIAYRGRKLPTVYGELGYEKYCIGVEMKKIADEAGIASDIEVDNAKRIYGAAWYQFLGSARAMLGTESGANVFDFDGSLKSAIAKLEAENPEITYEEISATILAPHEGLVQMNQISPKVFEAICLRTALVLFEGSYSNIVLPNVHFIPLKKDFSNAQEVICKLQDIALVQQMTERAYADIVVSGKYSYQGFIKSFDADIEARILRLNKIERLNTLYFLGSDGKPKQALPMMPVGRLEEAQEPYWKLTDFSLNKPVSVYLILQMTWHLLSLTFRVKFLQIVRMIWCNPLVSQTVSLLFQVIQKAWRLLPSNLRSRLPFPLGLRERLTRILARD